MSTIQLVINQYLNFSLEMSEQALDTWLNGDWDKAQFRDLLIPYLIQRKLELNEEEY